MIIIIYFFSSENFEPTLGRGFEPNLDKGLIPGVEYTRTLGNWGRKQPEFCNETTPNSKVCNACKLACSSKHAWDRCQTCLKLL